MALANGVAGLLVVGYDNSGEIKPFLKKGTVAVTVDQLAVLPSHGLVFTVRSTAVQLDQTTSPPTLTNEAVMESLGLATPELQSRVMPVVTNMEQYISRLLMAAYDKKTRPFSHMVERPTLTCSKMSAPTVVVSEFYLLSLHSVDQIGGSYELDGYFRLWWNDTRLRYDGLAPNACIEELRFDPGEIWTPDIYFDGSLDDYKTFAPGPPQPSSSSMTVSPDGLVYWTRHARLKLGCDMDFRELPFDRQICRYKAGTWSTQSTDVLMQWNDLDLPFPEWYHPETSEAPWKLVAVNASSPVASWSFADKTGTWSFAEAVFTLEHLHAGYHPVDCDGVCVLLRLLGVGLVGRGTAPRRPPDRRDATADSQVRPTGGGFRDVDRHMALWLLPLLLHCLRRERRGHPCSQRRLPPHR